MGTMRTSFLRSIANGEEIRYSYYSSVTSCLVMMHCATKNLTQRFVRFTNGQGILATPSADRIGEAKGRE